MCSACARFFSRNIIFEQPLQRLFSFGRLKKEYSLPDDASTFLFGDLNFRLDLKALVKVSLLEFCVIFMLLQTLKDLNIFQPYRALYPKRLSFGPTNTVQIEELVFSGACTVRFYCKQFSEVGKLS